MLIISNLAYLSKKSDTLTCMILGVTGPIGAGKSTAIEIIRTQIQLGTGHFYHLDLDRLGHLILKKDDVKLQLVSVFGEDILTNGDIDRSRLGAIVFKSDHQYTQLTEIMYPAIKKSVERYILQKPSSALMVMDGAMMHAIDLLGVCDEILVTLTDPNADAAPSIPADRRRFQPSDADYRTFGHHIVINQYDHTFNQAIENWLKEITR